MSAKFHTIPRSGAISVQTIPVRTIHDPDDSPFRFFTAGYFPIQQQKLSKLINSITLKKVIPFMPHVGMNGITISWAATIKSGRTV